jgi:hypothetical integral membrane protein (TIGR02206 family)
MVALDFFAREQTSPPTVTLAVWVGLVLLATAIVLVCYRYRDRVATSWVMRCLQLSQLVAINYWFLLMREPITESLPLYHCRLSMWGMVLLRDSKLKTFLALLGAVGGVLSIGYAEFYPYTWLHATQYSYYFGHVFLLANSLLHLWNTRNWLSYREIAFGVLGINLLLAVLNTALGSNYGYTHHTPVLGSDQVWLNVAAVSLLLIAMMSGAQWMVMRRR